MSNSTGHSNLPWRRVDANLKSRIATAAIGIPLLIGWVGWSPPWLFSIIFFVLTVAALREYFVMAFPGRRKEQWLGILFGIGLSAAIFLAAWIDPLVIIDLALLAGFAACLFSAGVLSDRLHRLWVILLGGMYLGYFLPHWLLLFQAARGRAWVFWVLAVIMIGDTFAYFVGRRWGDRKLAPAISPAKTIAGAVGYSLGAMIAGVVGALFLDERIGWLEALALALILSILGQIGDLFESWIKRVFAVKDSGDLLPGHGGLLDRFDSLIFPAVFTTAYLKVFHP